MTEHTDCADDAMVTEERDGGRRGGTIQGANEIELFLVFMVRL